MTNFMVLLIQVMERWLGIAQMDDDNGNQPDQRSDNRYNCRLAAFSGCRGKLATYRYVVTEHLRSLHTASRIEKKELPQHL